MLQSADNGSERTQSDGTGTQCFGGGNGGAGDSNGESGTHTLSGDWGDAWGLIDTGVGKIAGTWHQVKHIPQNAPSSQGAPVCAFAESCCRSAAPPTSCTSTAQPTEAASKWKTRSAVIIRRMHGKPTGRWKWIATRPETAMPQTPYVRAVMPARILRLSRWGLNPRRSR